MATRCYLHNDAAPYTPATIRGAWDSYASAVTKRIDSSRLPVSAAANVAVAETSTTDEWDILLYRGVSGPLAAQTISAGASGTVTVLLPVVSSNLAANLHYHLHIYVTQGDSDVVRGTLLADYREAAGVNEWDTAMATCGRALSAAQTVQEVTASAGDRIVVEIGYSARNTSATSYSGTLYYGVPQGKGVLAVGGPSTDIGYIEFSETLAGTAVVRATQGAVEVALDEDTAQAARVSQGAVEVAIQSTGDILRVSQVLVEAAWPTIIISRVSQIVAEVLCPNVVESRITQVVAELLDASTPLIRVSQLVVELLGKSSTYSGIPTLSPAALCGKPDVLAWLEWTVPVKEN